VHLLSRLSPTVWLTRADPSQLSRRSFAKRSASSSSRLTSSLLRDHISDRDPVRNFASFMPAVIDHRAKRLRVARDVREAVARTQKFDSTDFATALVPVNSLAPQQAEDVVF
jgi:hypothetical protein